MFLRRNKQRRPGGRVRSSTRVTLALLGLALVLTAALGFEAWQAQHQHRATVRRVLEDYARLAAWQFSARAVNALDVVQRVFGHMAGMRLAPGTPLPPVEKIIATTDSAARCSDQALDAERYYFRWDRRTRRFDIHGPRPSDSVLAIVSDTIERRLVTTGYEEWYLAPMLRLTATGPRALIYVTVRDLKDQPWAAYGFETCNAALWERIFQAAMAFPLLPPVLTGYIPNDSLLSLKVIAQGQFTGEYRSPVQYPSTYSVSVYEQVESRGGLKVHVALRPLAAEKLIIGGVPRSRLPLLVVLMLVTAGVVVVSAIQLARENEVVRLRADFTSSVSHELRTPLAEILLFAETLELERFPDEAQRKNAVGIIAQEARHLTRIVDNVLQFSRAERRMLQIAPEWLDGTALLRDILAGFAPVAAASQAAIGLDAGPAERMFADRSMFRQVTLNLLDNAVKYGPAGQQIVVRLTSTPRATQLRIEDQGPGIPPSDRERIWEPFVRLATAPGHITGSGIGLAVVRNIVVGHGGKHGVEARPGGGAIFVVEWPKPSEGTSA